MKNHELWWIVLGLTILNENLVIHGSRGRGDEAGRTPVTRAKEADLLGEPADSHVAMGQY